MVQLRDSMNIGTRSSCLSEGLTTLAESAVCPRNVKLRLAKRCSRVCPLVISMNYVERSDDRRVISGIVQRLSLGRLPT